jgi:hypothetical protein
MTSRHAPARGILGVAALPFSRSERTFPSQHLRGCGPLCILERCLREARTGQNKSPRPACSDVRPFMFARYTGFCRRGRPGPEAPFHITATLLSGLSRSLCCRHFVLANNSGNSKGPRMKPQSGIAGLRGVGCPSVMPESAGVQGRVV